MTATDELRRILDERGVEWTAPESYNGSYDYDTIVGEYWYHEYDGKLTVHGLTPKQAIEATLGRGECRLISAPQYGEGCQECSSCGAVLDGYLFDGGHCPNCKAKVVDE